MNDSTLYGKELISWGVVYIFLPYPALWNWLKIDLKSPRQGTREGQVT